MGSRLDELSWPVRTRRLLIRPARDADVEAAWSYRRRADVSLWLTAAPESLEEFRTRFAEPDRLARTLVIELAGVLIGDLALGIQDGWAQTEVASRAAGVQAELGWVLDPDYGGHGYATEGVAAMIRLCFENLGLRRVTAGCFADNEPSWRLMERLGMRREIHSVRESLHRSGEWLDGVEYALLADEWNADRPPG